MCYSEFLAVLNVSCGVGNLSVELGFVWNGSVVGLMVYRRGLLAVTTFVCCEDVRRSSV